MDIRQASHGLHIAAANRIYIVNPIWQPSVEAQAIKRAHRIGQTKPVYVETLVLRGTLEDRMLKRRKEMSNVELRRAEKSLLDDGTMNRIIKEMGFLKFGEGEERIEGRVARLRVPQKLFGRTRVDEGIVPDESSRSARSVMEGGEGENSQSQPQPRISKRVRIDG